MTENLVELLPVMVGGAIAILAGISGAFFGVHFEAQKSRNETKRSKLERIVELSHSVSTWLSSRRNRALFEQNIAQEEPPLPKIEAIAELYFPSLKENTHQLAAALVKCDEAICNQLDRKMEDREAWLADETKNTEFLQAYEEVLKANKELQKEAKAQFDQVFK